MWHQTSPPLLPLTLGVAALLMGYVPYRVYVAQSRRMISPLTIIGHGGRSARRQMPWYWTLGWLLMLGGASLLLMGLWTACASG